jgi:hypothetical protein
MQTKRDADKYFASNNEKFVVCYIQIILCMVYVTMLSASHTIYSLKAGWQLSNELEITRKEEI